ncbi:MAG: hypothetical protein GF307_04915 [candidate division Zixibacteria bacterium]|nr:hypothetical protein [candidate division Zixibacteria bacterium]
MKTRFAKTGKIRNQNGVILVTAAVLTFALVTTGFAFMMYVADTHEDTNLSIKRQQAIYQARSITNRMLIGHSGASTKDEFDVFTNVDQEVDIDAGDLYDFLEENTGLTIAHAVVKSAGVDDEDWVRAAQFYYVVDTYSPFHYYGTKGPFVRMKIANRRVTMANYLYISDVELDPINNWPISFWGRDTLDGLVHSNGLVYTQYDPVFWKTVSSCSSYVSSQYGQPRFYGDPPTRLEADPIYFPYTAVKLREAAWQKGVGNWNPERLDPGYFIRGVPPDIVTCVKICGNKVGVRFKRVTNHREPVFTTIADIDSFGFWLNAVNQDERYGGTPVYVEGMVGAESLAVVYLSSNTDPAYPIEHEHYGVNQRITVGCSGSIMVNGDIVYNRLGRVTAVPESYEHATGIIADRWVYIKDSIRLAEHGPIQHDVYIHAGVVALNPSFTVHGIHDANPYNRPSEKGQIQLYGCLAHKNRAAVHRGGPPPTGYAEKDYRYDHRFQFRPPPYFIEISSELVVFDIREIWDWSLFGDFD